MKIGGGDLPVPAVDPKDPNTVYSASIVTVRSTDGGKTWISLRGAPGGDDYQNLWINPENPNIILLVSDQGALVSVNKGESWSSWYNQPTAQLYHVAVTNSFPTRSAPDNRRAVRYASPAAAMTARSPFANGTRRASSSMATPRLIRCIRRSSTAPDAAWFRSTT
jgi:hypothetical protein